MGILCKHALMVFNSMDVTVLPKSYILKRWMKNVRNRVSSDLQESGSGGVHVSEMVFVNQIMRSVYDLSQLSKSHEDVRKRIYELVDTAKDELSNFVQNLSVDYQTPCGDIPNDCQMDEVCIRNPLTAKAKGHTNANITRHWDTKSKKGKGKGKIESPSAKGAKRKEKRSKDAINTQEMNYIPSQHSNFPLSQYQFASPQFPSQFGHNQPLRQHSNDMSLFGYPFGTDKM